MNKRQGLRGFKKSLRDFENKELIEILDHNDNFDLYELAGIVSEILRRMNEEKDIIPIVRIQPVSNLESFSSSDPQEPPSA